MSPSQIIVLATPVFGLLILLELAWGFARGRNTYRLDDAVNSIGLGMLSQISAVFTRLLRIGIYTAVYSSVALFPDAPFWQHWTGWLAALVLYDFCYYWLHRYGHESAVLWAAHVVHHQSEDYNLSTALRQTSSGVLLGWIFYLPMAVLGVPPLLFGIVALVDLLYQFWVHTEHVPKLGWFDRWFCSPSNHRVHHAVNDAYVDRNYGGILIVWDRLFGSFKEEGEPCVYGTRSPLRSWDPLWANLEVYQALAHDSWHAKRWGDKLRVWLRPPGWRPADVAARFPKPPFSLVAVRRYAPQVSRAAQLLGAAQFVLLLAGSLLFLWQADAAPLATNLLWFTALTAGLWSTGALLQGRLGVAEVLMVDAAVLATATGAAGFVEWHRVFKPAVLAIALAALAARPRATPAAARFDALLAAALAASLVGDAFLMFPGYFVPGLVAFLVAHLFYIALFSRGVPWFPSRRVLLGVAAYGAVMVAVLWPHLPPALRAPVAVYVAAIVAMGAQALGRGLALRTCEGAGAVGVAAGAALFMASDTLLALNKFVAPLPAAQLWVLGTYFAAQFLIVRYARRPGSGAEQVVTTHAAGAPLGR